jgi:predicted metalloprotease with PDZ domain
MLWLDVDTMIRQQTGGKRSLDDFARGFFGIHDGSRVTVTYTFAEVCAGLAQVAAYDWAAFLRRRLDAHDDRGLLDGLTRGGYRLVYSDTPTEAFVQAEADNGATDLGDSIGLTVTSAGTVRSVAWQGPAFKAAIPIGAHLVSVNGKPYDRDVMKSAVKAAATAPLEVVFEVTGARQTTRIDYHGTLRYPRLQRIAGTPDRLGRLLEPLPR